MSHPSKRRGDRAELELAGILSGLLGLPVKRMLGAGRQEDVGDLHGLPLVTAQVKNFPRSGIAAAINDGLDDLDRQQPHAGTPFGVVFVRRPRGRWIAVMDVDRWATFYREVVA